LKVANRTVSWAPDPKAAVGTAVSAANAIAMTAMDHLACPTMALNAMATPHDDNQVIVPRCPLAVNTVERETHFHNQW
jgi:hypothetical protein